MSRLLFATSLLATALGSSTAVWLVVARPLTSTSQAHPEAHAEAHAKPAPRRTRRPHLDLRPRIVEEEQRELPGLSDRTDVEAYLDRLEARARAQGQATAVEIEPGMTAIFALRGTEPEEQVLAMADAFDARMQAVSAELGAVERPVPPSFEEGLAALARAEDPEDQQAAIREALDAIEDLDEPTRLQAEARLDAALEGRVARVDAEPESLRQAIDDAEDPQARASAVQRYVEVVENLPREQAAALLAEVERGELPGASLL